MNLDRRLLRQAVVARAALAGAILAGLLLGLATLLWARQLAGILARVFLQGHGLADEWPALWLLLAILLARVALSYLGELSALSAALRVKQHLRQALAARLMAAGPVFVTGQRSGELVNTATQGIEALDAYFSQYLPQLALAGLLPLAYLLVVFPLDPLSGLVLLLTGPLIPVFMFLIGSNAKRLTQRQWTALGRMSAYFLDILQGLVTLKALGRSREQAGRVAEVSERYRQATMSVLRVTFLSALALELLGTLGTAIIAVQIGLRLLYGRIEFEMAFFLLLLAPEFYFPLRQLGLRFHAAMTGLSAARDIFAILEQPVVAGPISAPASPPQPPQPPRRADAPPVIRLQGVGYTYPGRDRPALDDLTFEIPAGQKTALVGASGAGKSTLVQLLLRFLEPSHGQVLVDGRPLAHWPSEEWRAQVAWLPQLPYLFHGTLAENLRLARPGASSADLRRAAAFAHLDELLERLPLGLETPLGEGGLRLSSGQAQRVALARAFLRDAPLLVLDEPTAHLDVDQEQLLQATLGRLAAGRTVLVIAHRLPTVQDADQIVVLEQGRLVEQGAHATLLAQAGPYARLLSAYAAPGGPAG